MNAQQSFFRVITILKETYPRARIALNFSNPLELLVATILSAQCTDKRVNIITESLFKRYRSAQDYAHADIKTFAQEIRSAGFYNAKAKNIIAACIMIVTDFSGKVPGTMAELIQLPGVARKTANVVLFNAFGKNEGIAVDTHARRLSQRLGFTRQDDPAKIEQDLMRIVDKKDWGSVTYLFIEHGRAICHARKPLCLQCCVAHLCPSKNKFC